MSNNESCSTCALYWPLEKGVKGGSTKQLTRGYCLAKTIFPSNGIHNRVYPPAAKFAVTPQARIDAKIVIGANIVPNCPHRK